MRKYLLLSAAFFVTTGSAFAQTAQAPASNGGLEEVVVTAQRHAENAEHAAIALNVIQGSDLADAGIVTAGALETLVPALKVEATSTGNILFIRGVGNFTVVPASDPAIAFNYDGVYVGRPTSTNGVFYDLDRVEVLKGPQGILYGRNATGGAINVLPTQPVIGEDFSGNASVSYGNYNAVIAEGAVNIPLSDSAALRIAANESYHDGYLKDGTDDDSTTGVRVQVKDEVTPDLTVRIAADYSHAGGEGQGVSYLNVWSCPENSAAAPDGSLAAPCSITGKSPVSVNQGVNSPASQAWRVTQSVGGPVGNAAHLDPIPKTPFQNNDFYGVNAEVNYDTGFGVLTVVPAWRLAKLDFYSNAAAFDAGDVESDKQTSGEVRFAGKRISIFDYTVGFYDFNETINDSEVINLSAQEAFVRPNYKTDSWAPFGELTANITDNFRLVSGIRYTHDHKTVDSSSIGVTLICPVSFTPGLCQNHLIPYSQSYADLAPGYFPTLPTPGTPVAPTIIPLFPIVDQIQVSDLVQHLSQTSTRTTYREAAEWDVTDTSMAYASFETGYRSGGFSSSVAYPTYKPEYITAYTIGAKNRFFDDRLQLNLELFRWDYKNQQVNHVSLDPVTNSTANFTSNVGGSRIQGVEADATALVTPTTLLSADVQYLDAVYQSYVYSASYQVTPFGVSSPLTGCPAVKGPLAGFPGTTVWNIDCSGRPAYNSPKWTINLSAQQTVGLDGIQMPNYQIVLTADTQYKSSYDNGFAYLSDETIRPTWSSDAMIQFQPTDADWTVAAYVRNIENNQTPVFSTFGPMSLISVDTKVAPRTYGIRFSTKF